LQINIALGYIPVPAKHRVNGLRELGTIRLIDTASVHPKVLQVVTLRLFATKLYLAITSHLLVVAILQICQSNLLQSLSMRKNSIFLWYIAFKKLGEAEIAIVVVL
jgi:hypothetical protein